MRFLTIVCCIVAAYARPQGYNYNQPLGIQNGIASQPSLDVAAVSADSSLQNSQAAQSGPIASSAASISPIGIGIQQQAIGTQQQPIVIQQQPIGIQQQSVGIQQQPIGIQQQSIGVQQQPIGIQQQSIGIQQQSIGIQEQGSAAGQISQSAQSNPVASDATPISSAVIQQQPLGIQQQPLGIQQQPLGIQQQPLGIQQQPLGIQQQPLGIQQQFGAISSTLEISKPTPAPIILKQFFLHSAPEEQDEAADEVAPVPARKHYRVVFIKAPTENINGALRAFTQAQDEEKTAIYVLSKKTDVADFKQVVDEAPRTPSKPEVFFIKYKTAEEAAHAQQQIQAQYDALGGTSEISDEGLAPVTSVVGALKGETEAAADENAALTSSQYLPPAN